MMQKTGGHIWSIVNWMTICIWCNNVWKVTASAQHPSDIFRWVTMFQVFPPFPLLLSIKYFSKVHNPSLLSQAKSSRQSGVHHLPWPDGAVFVMRMQTCISWMFCCDFILQTPHCPKQTCLQSHKVLFYIKTTVRFVWSSYEVTAVKLKWNTYFLFTVNKVFPLYVTQQ